MEFLWLLKNVVQRHGHKIKKNESKKINPIKKGLKVKTLW